MKKSSVFLVCLLLILFYFGAKIREAAMPVCGALFLAYLAAPFVRFTSKIGIPKGFCAALFYIMIFSFVAVLLLFILPGVLDGLTEIYKYASLHSGVQSFIPRDKLLEFISEKADSISAFLKNAVGFLSKCTVSVILSCLFIMDSESIKEGFLSLIPEKIHMLFTPTLREINSVFRSFIRGQLLVSLLLSLITYIALIALKIKPALILSLLYGIFCLIPTVGPFLGAVPLVSVSYLQSPSRALFALGLVILTQAIDNTFISPKIKADSADISPAAAFTAIYLGASFFGIAGIILGVPIYASVKIILRRIIFAIS